jgi:DNA-directed RNA polymerase specialized sigma24 family protein
MSPPGSVTHWIDGLRTAESVAARKLWENYFHRLVELARKKLRALPRSAADEEDVALSAFDSFCRGAEQGRFPRLADRDDLWQVLFVLTQRKAVDLIQHEGREKRDWRKVEPVAAEGSPGADRAGREPDPAFAAQVAEECQRLLGALGDDSLRLLAVRKMEGYTNEEIAALLNCSLATVERRLRLIRKEWEAVTPLHEGFSHTPRSD